MYSYDPYTPEKVAEAISKAEAAEEIVRCMDSALTALKKVNPDDKEYYVDQLEEVRSMARDVLEDLGDYLEEAQDDAEETLNDEYIRSVL